MNLAVDVYYKNNYAKAVGVLFNWGDTEPKRIIIKKLSKIEDYIPGEFYKRELPCIMEVIKAVDCNVLKTIIVDGHIYIDNEKKYGLGGLLWEEINKKIPVIGVAKKSFYSNSETVIEILRGKSVNPLYVSSIGIDLNKSVEKIKNMKGKYRIPTILKTVDKLTKE